MRKNFNNIDIFAGNTAPVAQPAGESVWETAEHINVKQVYTAEDLKEMEHLDYAAGLPPFLRGPYSMMYTFRPWTIRQYAGFSTAEESNAFYRRNLAMRQARAQFSCNILAAAGYEVIDNLVFKSVEEGAKAAMDANADIVVICSSDDEYAEYAVPAYEAVKEKAIFIVAGAPACSDELKAAGIENFIHVRVNVLDTLKALNTKLGI